MIVCDESRKKTLKEIIQACHNAYDNRQTQCPCKFAVIVSHKCYNYRGIIQTINIRHFRGLLTSAVNVTAKHGAEEQNGFCQ